MTAGLLVLAAVLAVARPARAENDPWLGRDKALHFSASAVLAGGGYALGTALFEQRPPRIALGAGLALSAGIAKELWDRAGHGDPSFRDLAWDIVGTATGVAVAWAIDRIFFSRPRTVAIRPSSAP